MVADRPAGSVCQRRRRQKGGTFDGDDQIEDQVVRPDSCAMLILLRLFLNELNDAYIDRVFIQSIRDMNNSQVPSSLFLQTLTANVRAGSTVTTLLR